MALDRALLAKQEQRNQEQRRKKLRDEFDTLRKAFEKVKLVYNSPAMQELLSSARRVATTEATILITGESGTGKGVLAETIHNLSNRHDRPFVTVDCSSIAPTLIENELFGTCAVHTPVPSAQVWDASPKPMAERFSLMKSESFLWRFRGGF